MKNLFSLIILLFWGLATHAQIVITEISYNPPESGNDSLEYIEIHNPGQAAVDLTHKEQLWLEGQLESDVFTWIVPGDDKLAAPPQVRDCLLVAWLECPNDQTRCGTLGIHSITVPWPPNAARTGWGRRASAKTTLPTPCWTASAAPITFFFIRPSAKPM